MSLLGVTVSIIITPQYPHGTLDAISLISLRSREITVKHVDDIAAQNA